MLDVLLDLARSCHAEGDVESAFVLYRLYLRRDPDGGAARAEYRRRQREQTQFSEDPEGWRNASEKAISKAKVEKLFSGKTGPQLVLACEEALRSNPYDTFALMTLAGAAEKLGHWKSAACVLADLVELTGEKGDLLRRLGLAQYRGRDREAALATLQRLEELGKLAADDHEARGILTGEAKPPADDGSYRRRLRDASQAQQLEEREKVSWSRRRDVDARTAELQDQLENDELPKQTRLRAAHELVKILVSKSLYDHAVEVSAKADELAGTHDQMKATAKLKVARMQHRVEALRGELRTEAGENESATELRQAARDKWEVAVREYGILSERTPTADAELALLLGEACRQLGSLENDAELTRRAVAELQKENPDLSGQLTAAMLLGRCYGDLGWWDLARRQFASLLERLAEDHEGLKSKHDRLRREMEASYALADACRMLRDHDGEYAALARVVQKDITYRDSAERFDRLNARGEAPRMVEDDLRVGEPVD